MMHVTWNQQEVVISFRYVQRMSVAIMRRCEDDKVLAVNHVECHPSDQFCYAIGRRLALKRLLGHPMFNKAFRTEVWRAYWAKTPKPKKVRR